MNTEQDLKECIQILTMMYEKHRDGLDFASNELDRILKGSLDGHLVSIGQLKDLLVFMRIAGEAAFTLEQAKSRYERLREIQRGPKPTDADGQKGSRK